LVSNTLRCSVSVTLARLPGIQLLFQGVNRSLSGAFHAGAGPLATGVVSLPLSLSWF